MSMQTFYAPDMRQALHLIQHTLGEEAIIYSRRNVNGGVEVQAGLATTETATQPPAAVTTPKPVPEPTEEKIAPSALLNHMQAEIKQLRAFLQHQLAGIPWDKHEYASANHALLAQQFKNIGYCPSLLRQLMIDIDPQADYDTAYQQLAQKLITKLPILSPSLYTSGGTVALIGPTGVGKTTLIAKLATHYLWQHSADDIAIITTDNYRVAAKQQLQTYGQILNIPVYVANNSQELNHTLSFLTDKSLVLIDTAGFTPNNPASIQRLAMLQACGKSIDYHLVMAASSQPSVIEKTLQSISHLPVTAAILSRVDEVEQLAPVLSLLMQQALPLSFLSNGQHVPDDIVTAEAEPLINATLSNNDITDTDDNTNDNQFSELMETLHEHA